MVPELSKLSTAQTYPEYARALLESAPVGFNVAVSEWEKRHGKVQGHLGRSAHMADSCPWASSRSPQIARMSMR